MTTWEGVDPAERRFVREHQSLSTGAGDASPESIVPLNCLGERRKSSVWREQ